jgi:hypothetical protein
MKPAASPVPLPSPLDALPDMRSAAKWTIASLGAVGAALVAVVPLSALNRLQDPADIAVVVIGFVLGAGGVAWAIWHTAEALTPPITTLADLESDALAGLRKRITESPESFLGPFGSSTAELLGERRFHEVVAGNLADAVAAETDPERLAVWRRALDDALANLAHARSLQQQLLEFGHAWQVRAKLRNARLQTMAGTAAIVIGLVLVMIATATPV